MYCYVTDVHYGLFDALGTQVRHETSQTAAEFLAEYWERLAARGTVPPPPWKQPPPAAEEVFPNNWYQPPWVPCECGARFTTAPDSHMHYCPKFERGMP